MFNFIRGYCSSFRTFLCCLQVEVLWLVVHLDTTRLVIYFVSIMSINGTLGLCLTVFMNKKKKKTLN